MDQNTDYLILLYKCNRTASGTYTTYALSSHSCSTGAHKKAYLLAKVMGTFSGEQKRTMDHQQKNDTTEIRAAAPG